MSDKYTPWTFRRAPMADERFYVFDSRGRAVWCGSDVEDEERGPLIAAAPELLDALETMGVRTDSGARCFCARTSDVNLTSKVHDARCTRARTAIAKVRGES